MMNLGPILKMLGIKIAPETLIQIEALIPQIPSKANELIAANMDAIKNFDERLRKIEESNQALLSFVNRTHQQLEEIRNGKRARSGSGDIAYGSNADRDDF